MAFSNSNPLFVIFIGKHTFQTYRILPIIAIQTPVFLKIAFDIVISILNREHAQ